MAIDYKQVSKVLKNISGPDASSEDLQYLENSKMELEVIKKTPNYAAVGLIIAVLVEIGIAQLYPAHWNLMFWVIAVTVPPAVMQLFRNVLINKYIKLIDNALKARSQVNE